MARISKKRKASEAKVDKTKVYTLKDASSLVKTINTTKFDASVDLRAGVELFAEFHDINTLGTQCRTYRRRRISLAALYL